MDTKFDELLEFPCSFSYRIIVNAEADCDNCVKKKVKEITNKEVIDIRQMNTSKNKKYNSKKLTVKVENKEELEKIYSEITKIEGIKLIL